MKIATLKYPMAAICLTLGVGILSGCNAGMSPPGQSVEEAKATFNKLPVEERAKEYLNMPGDSNVKRQHVLDMFEKEGKKVPDEILKQIGGSSPVGTTAAP